MKKYIYYILPCLLLAVLTGCEKDLETYSDSQARLNFYWPSTTTNVIDYSFVYHGSATVQDTVWLDVRTMGYVADTDRPVALKQVTTGDNDAVAGTDYVPFDDSSLQSLYVIKAGSNQALVPVVVKRTEAMKTTEKTLQVTFADNGVFMPGYESKATHIIHISDILSKPANWDTYFLHYYIAYWTRGMHQFIIDQTGEPWDDDYIANVLTVDSGFLTYMGEWLPKRLEEVNAERVAQGLGVLMEDDGVTPVAFVKYNPWG